MRIGLTAALAASIVVMVGAAPLAVSPAAAAPIVVDARAVPLDAAEPERTRVGGLEYLGGVQLSSPDPRFGGWSGLLVSGDETRLIAVSDEGWVLTGRLLEDSDGRLAGVDGCDLRPLLSPAGTPLGGASKTEADAESIARDGEGFLVGFERDHRILRYPGPGGRPEPFPAPPGLAAAPVNAGLESLTRLPDGRLLAFTEGLVAPGSVVGWVGGRGKWQPLSWITSEGFQPSDVAALPGGAVLVLERRFPPPGVRIRKVPASAIVAGAVLDGTEIARFEGSLTTDNMEGIATRPAPGGPAYVYLLSDDNYSALQRTLLMKFRVAE